MHVSLCPCVQLLTETQLEMERQMAEAERKRVALVHDQLREKVVHRLNSVVCGLLAASPYLSWLNHSLLLLFCSLATAALSDGGVPITTFQAETSPKTQST